MNFTVKNLKLMNFTVKKSEVNEFHCKKSQINEFHCKKSDINEFHGQKSEISLQVCDVSWRVCACLGGAVFIRSSLGGETACSRSSSRQTKVVDHRLRVDIPWLRGLLRSFLRFQYKQ